MGCRTDALADLLQLSLRGLRTRFADQRGIGPTLWLQLGWFDALLRAGPRVETLADVSAALGFADHAHRTAEFARFAGVPPGRYARARSGAAAPEDAPHFLPVGGAGKYSISAREAFIVALLDGRRECAHGGGTVWRCLLAS